MPTRAAAAKRPHLLQRLPHAVQPLSQPSLDERVSLGHPPLVHLTVVTHVPVERPARAEALGAPRPRADVALLQLLRLLRRRLLLLLRLMLLLLLLLLLRRRPVSLRITVGSRL